MQTRFVLGAKGTARALERSGDSDAEGRATLVIRRNGQPADSRSTLYESVYLKDNIGDWVVSFRKKHPRAIPKGASILALKPGAAPKGGKRKAAEGPTGEMELVGPRILLTDSFGQYPEYFGAKSQTEILVLGGGVSSVDTMLSLSMEGEIDPFMVDREEGPEDYNNIEGVSLGDTPLSDVVFVKLPKGSIMHPMTLEKANEAARDDTVAISWWPAITPKQRREFRKFLQPVGEGPVVFEAAEDDSTEADLVRALTTMVDAGQWTLSSEAARAMERASLLVNRGASLDFTIKTPEGYEFWYENGLGPEEAAMYVGAPAIATAMMEKRRRIDAFAMYRALFLFIHRMSEDGAQQLDKFLTEKRARFDAEQLLPFYKANRPEPGVQMEAEKRVAAIFAKHGKVIKGNQLEATPGFVGRMLGWK